MSILESIPINYFETAGLVVGLSANVVIAIQVFKEFKSPQISSLSLGYIIGWWFIFLFWFFYGIRLGAIAITVGNGLAFVIQTLLFIVVYSKNAKLSKE